MVSGKRCLLLFAAGILLFLTSSTEAQKWRNGQKVKVTTVPNEPYVFKRENAGEKFRGYGIDLLDEIAAKAGFNYTIYIQPDKKYGSLDSSGRWMGMIGEVKEGRADLALADMTMTAMREEAIDFSMPYMNTGLTILYAYPDSATSGIFTFLSPLTVGVWLVFVVAYIVASGLFYALQRFSPCESSGSGQYAAAATGEGEEAGGGAAAEPSGTRFSVADSFWYLMATMFQQKTELTPRGTSTRFLSVLWWMFTLVLIATYTANLAAFLTVTRQDMPFESAEDLAKQSQIKYGAYCCGSTNAFFQSSTNPVYEKMSAAMTREVMTAGNAEGVDKVLQGGGKYAFIMEAAAADYHVERNCDLRTVGGLLNAKGYGLAMTPGSSLKPRVDRAILELQENGRLAELKRKWWSVGTEECEDKTLSFASLGLANVAGVFIIFVIGMVIAVLIAGVEVVLGKKNKK